MLRSFIICLLLLSGCLMAQDWKWEAPLELAKKEAYHDVTLGADFTCHLNPALGNLRLLDETGEEVPYLLFSEGQTDQEVSLRWYPRRRDDYWRRWYSRSVFQNPKADIIDRMVLKIRNADVRQTFWLSGSDDMNRWYIVKEDFAYDSNYDPESSYNLVTIDFPPVDYKYYKVEIRHHWHEPIQIMGAGYYSVSETEGNYLDVPRPEVIQHENGSKSIIDISFNGSHYLDRVFFEIDGPEMYHRKAVLMKKNSYGGYQTLESFVLDSRSVHLLHFEALRSGNLRLEIENQDDKPLKAAGVQAMQLRKYITAKLRPEKSYTLKVGTEDLRSPQYDLTYFGSDLPVRRPSVRLNKVVAIQPPPVTQANPAPAATEEKAPVAVSESPTREDVKPSPFLQGKVFLWVGIVFIVLVIGFMAFRMLKDLEK